MGLFDNKKGKGKRPNDDKSRFTVKHNKWDAEDYQDVRKEVAKLPAATESLGEIISEDRARPEMSDVFMLFMKASPDFEDKKEIRDSARVSLKVNEELKDVDEFTQLRRFTRGDKVGSALAAVRIEPTLETLFDRVKKQQEEADQLEGLREKLKELLKQKGQQPQDGEQGQGQPQPGSDGDVPDNIDDLIDELEKEIEEKEQELDRSLDDESESIQSALSDAMQDALDSAREEAENARAWGVEPGQLLRMPADVRLKMAAKMNQDRLRRIAELFGPMHNLAIAPRQRRVEDIPHEIKRVTIGNDLNRLIPYELSIMDDEDLDYDWLKRYANRSLQQYKMDGTERVGKGGLVCCLDSSSSMSGNPELMSKAVMLCLLNICKKEGREFHLIHFGSRGLIREFSFRNEREYRADKVIEAAELFLNSGTDFETPLGRALDILNEEFSRTGRARSDVVFLTDGECGVSEQFKERFRTNLEKLDAQCWGIAIGCRRTSEPLFSLCGGQVCTVSDLQNAGKEIKEIFAGVQR